ncbi:MULTISPECIES: tetratricopeptide repeat-containing sulfotransferase family protein [Kordiimonas]|jgi:cytochrome c-type biogenesis protein CcmH/NrfG|uniref:tetratricopeptide repeat-containing sulfotransferase family protein n=1 Tax=Kordiimonas TaxID=288021 RepID=UPI0025802377|nr:tetratricopeptide repeat-containing sulfotransferase family protein [Kordiimonas sp. UBA4487]
MTALQQIDALMKERRLAEAGDLAALLAEKHPTNPDGWRRLGRVHEASGNFSAMLTSFQKVVELAKEDLHAHLKVAQALIQQGDLKAATDELARLRALAWGDSYLLMHTGQLYTHLSVFDLAYDCFKRSVALAPKDTQALYNLATAATAVGDLDEAVALYDQVIALKPSDYDAYYNRATLRKWTADNNHIAEMEALLRSGVPDMKGAVQLFYALAKEYEDLGDAGASFAHLRRGADLRASMMAYHVSTDTGAMADIERVFSADFFKGGVSTSDAPGPIFIVGLPRTGTTLVDRILSSHSSVDSLGEIHDFAQSLMRLAGPASNKTDLIEKSAALDFEALGEAYLTSTAARGQAGPYLVDKTPANFLYLGLIARAMPTARIIHLQRGAMDSCFAIYKTLFRLGYPYSYRLEDLADYFIAYRKLMAHWHAVLPGRILDVSYESLVADLDGQTRRMLDHCGLPFEDACLTFHENKSASATASAAQVRQPLYASSVGRWKDHAEALASLKARLEAAGITTEGGAK